MRPILKSFFFLVFSSLFVFPVPEALSATESPSWKTITKINQVKSVLRQADAKTLVVFDVDYVIITPKDLLGRPKAKSIRQPIFKEYIGKYGKYRVQDIWALYMIQGERELVEPEIRDILFELKKSKIPTIALTAIGTKAFGPVQDPMRQRLKDLNNQGISFARGKTLERLYWGDDSGFYQGIVFSGSQSKGEALKHYIQHIHKSKIKRVVFIDDNLKHVKNVLDMCAQLGLECYAFHYVADTFENDPPLDPDLARFQIKMLDQNKQWISDKDAIEAYKAAKIAKP